MPTYSIKGRLLIWLSHESPEDSCLVMCFSRPHTCPLCCLSSALSSPQRFIGDSLPWLSLPTSRQTLSGAAAFLSVASGLLSQGPQSRQLLTCRVFQTPVLTSLSCRIAASGSSVTSLSQSAFELAIPGDSMVLDPGCSTGRNKEQRSELWVGESVVCMDLGVSIVAIENRREIVCGKRREQVEKMDVLPIFQTERE